MKRGIAAKAYLILVYSIFYIPILTLIALSFNQSEYSQVWHGFTWHWYHSLFTDDILWKTALNSAIIGVLSSTLAVIIGCLAAVALFRYQFFGKTLLYFMTFILIVTPDIVVGTSLLVLYSYFHMPLGFWSLLMAHISFCIPFAIVTIYSRLLTLDKNIVEAAKDLGANDLRIFFKIIVPLISVALLTAWLLSFTLSFDDVMISYFVSGPNFQILPLYVYAMARVGVNPEINALTSILLIFTLFLVFLLHFTLRKKS